MSLENPVNTRQLTCSAIQGHLGRTRSESSTCRTLSPVTGTLAVLAFLIAVFSEANASHANESHPLCSKPFSKAELEGVAGVYSLELGTAILTGDGTTFPLEFAIPNLVGREWVADSRLTSEAVIQYSDEPGEGRYENGSLYLANPMDGTRFPMLRAFHPYTEFLFREYVLTELYPKFESRPSSSAVWETPEKLIDGAAEFLRSHVDPKEFDRLFGEPGVNKFEHLTGCRAFNFPWYLIPGVTASRDGYKIVFLYRVLMTNHSDTGTEFVGFLEWWGEIGGSEIHMVRPVALSKNQ